MLKNRGGGVRRRETLAPFSEFISIGLVNSEEGKVL